MNGKMKRRVIGAALLAALVAGTACSGGDKKTAGPGPTKVIAGVPVGYQHSKAGATVAALTYEATLARLGQPSQSQTRRAALDVMALPARRDEIVAAATEAYAFLEKNLGPSGISRGAVLGYRVKGYDETAAEIEMWQVTVVGQPETVPARAVWTTRTVQLRWAANDWKITGTAHDQPGPTPTLDGAPSDSAQVIANARQLDEVRYVPTQ